MLENTYHLLSLESKTKKHVKSLLRKDIHRLPSSSKVVLSVSTILTLGNSMVTLKTLASFIGTIFLEISLLVLVLELDSINI